MITAQASMATVGYTAPPVEKALGRAEELSRQIGKGGEMFPTLVGLCGYYFIRPDARKAREFAQQMVEIALADGSPAFVSNAYSLRGCCLCCLGCFDEALGDLALAVARYPGRATVNDADTLVVSLGYRAVSVFLLGHPDEALEMTARGLEHARLLNHPHSIALAQNFDLQVRCARREKEAAQEAEALIAFCKDKGLPYYEVLGGLYRSLALLEKGSPAEALDGLAERRAYRDRESAQVAGPQDIHYSLAIRSTRGNSCPRTACNPRPLK